MQDTNYHPNLNGMPFDLSQPKVMGILNITPDSFYDGGNYLTVKDAINQVEKMIAEGAAMIDIGAQSTRPQATFISAEEETNRLLPLLKIIRKEFPTIHLSIDTFHAAVAEKAIAEGADIINDISGGTMDAAMFSVIAKNNTPYVLMHIQGNPENMQQAPSYKNVVEEVDAFFTKQIEKLHQLGATKIILDPGFGFGKNIAHNYALLKQLSIFKKHQLPILVGVSRKSMINKVLNIKAADALNGTTVLNTIALLNGASILRVHDVKEAVEAVKLVALYEANL